MANIQTELDKLNTALYGSEVRQSIHDALKAGNNEIEAYTGAESERQSAEQNRKISETARQQAEAHRQTTNAKVEELIDNFAGSLVIANTATAGLVKAGGDIAVAADGTVTVKKEAITNTIKSTVATAAAPGAVKAAGDITVAADGTVTVKKEVITNTIQSTVATAASPGAVKSGGDISVTKDGLVSIPGLAGKATPSYVDETAARIKAEALACFQKGSAETSSFLDEANPAGIALRYYKDITFQKAFGKIPTVLLSLRCSNKTYGSFGFVTSNVTTTGFTIRCEYNFQTILIDWLAIDI